MIQTAELYRTRKEELQDAGAVLADAFGADPVWVKLLDGYPKTKFDRTIAAFYEASIRYCLRYGEVYATSEYLEGVIAWVPGDLADMTLWRQIRSGALLPSIRASMLLGTRSLRAVRALAPVPPAREANMGGRTFTYLQVLGVATELQGRGYGGTLLGALVERSDTTGIPVYTETTLEGAVGVYERYGFQVIDQITLPVLDLPLWEFVREPAGF